MPEIFRIMIDITYDGFGTLHVRFIAQIHVMFYQRHQSRANRTWQETRYGSSERDARERQVCITYFLVPRLHTT